MLTFKQALDQLTAIGAFPPDADNVKKKAILNDCLERYITSDRFLGSDATINIHVDSSGILTLPRRFKSIKGIIQDGVAINLASKWWNYAPGLATDSQKLMGTAQMLGSGFATFSDLTSAARLKISGDPTGTVRIQGLDANGNQIYDNAGGLGFDIPFSNTPSTQYVSLITAIEMPLTDAPKILTAVYDDTTTQTLGIYEPGETIPDYTRYFLPSATITGTTGSSVTALCQRQFVPCVADTDLVYPSNFAALKHGVIAIVYEDAGEDERAEFRFNKGLKLLNEEIKRARPPSEMAAVRVNYPMYNQAKATL